MLIHLFAILNIPIIVDGIYGGEDVSNPHEFPWMAKLIIYKSNKKSPSHCGGNIISKDLILTAAHCVFNVKSEENALNIYAVVGHSDWTSSETKSST